MIMEPGPNTIVLVPGHFLEIGVMIIKVTAGSFHVWES